MQIKLTFPSSFNLLEHGAKVETIWMISKYLFSLEEIFSIIKEAGFDITQMKEILLTKEQADKIYFKITNKDFYKDVLEILSE